MKIEAISRLGCTVPVADEDGVLNWFGEVPQFTDLEIEEEIIKIVLEKSKENRIKIIEEEFIKEETTTIPFIVNGVEYLFYGGIDSVDSIDKYVRLMELAGATIFTIWDVDGIEHTLNLAEVQSLMLSIGIQSSINKFNKKNRKKAVIEATTIDEVEAS